MKKPTDLAIRLNKYFRDYLVNGKNLKNNTLETYKFSFKLLFMYFKEVYGKSPEQITMRFIDANKISSFLDWLENSRNCSISSRNSRLAAIHSFFRYLQISEPETMLKYQKIMTIPLKKYTKPLINHMTKEQITELFCQPNQMTKSGRRELTILATLYDTGARVQEICNLRVCDVRVSKPAQILINGKGGKIRITPIIGNTLKLLSNYIKENHLDDEYHLQEPLFQNQRHQSLSRSGITYILQKNIKRMNDPKIKKIPTPHILRHSKAVHLLQGGVSLEIIRELLGHESIQTTEIYAKMDLETKRKVLEENYNENIIPNIKKEDWCEDLDLLSFLDDL